MIPHIVRSEEVRDRTGRSHNLILEIGSSDNNPIECASPKIKSNRDSILGFGISPLNVIHPE